MSVEITIFATEPGKTCTGEVCGFWNANASQALLLEYGPLQLSTISGQISPSSEEIPFGKAYLPKFSKENTISIYRFDTDEIDSIESLIDNYLAADEAATLASRIRAANVRFSLESLPGRGPMELQAMLIIAAGIAKTCGGIILIDEAAVFGLPDKLFVTKEIVDIFGTA